MPRPCSLYFLLDHGAAFTTIERIIERKADAVRARPGDDTAKKCLISTCLQTSSKFKDEASTKFLTDIALECGCLDTLKSTIDSHTAPLTARVVNDLCSALETYGFDAAKER